MKFINFNNSWLNLDHVLFFYYLYDEEANHYGIKAALNVSRQGPVEKHESKEALDLRWNELGKFLLDQANRKTVSEHVGQLDSEGTPIE